MANNGRNYTGERIPTPKLEAIKNALSLGEPIENIARRLHSSTQSVIATRERESLDITRRKELIRASAARLAANGFDKLNREMDAGRITGQLLVTATGVATDKVVLLSSNDPFGQQHLHLHQHVQTRDASADFNDHQRNLQAVMKAMQAVPESERGPFNDLLHRMIQSGSDNPLPLTLPASAKTLTLTEQPHE